MILLVTVALAEPLSVAPSDGVAPTGPARPAWILRAREVEPGVEYASGSAELAAAWAARAALDNEAAQRRVDALITRLSPVLDSGQRELLQRALFLRGVLAADDAGGIGRVPGAVDVDGQRVPPDWVAAIRVSPGAPAPASADADRAVRLYEQARTRLVASGGVRFDPAVPGEGEVRVDGAPVREALTLLPGTHTLSWHVPGSPPRALVFHVGEVAAIEALEHEVATGALTGATRAALREELGSVAAWVEVDGRGSVVWLVDGPGRWGPPALAGGLTVGGAILATGGAATPDRCGVSERSDAPTKGLAPLGALATLDVGPWAIRAGGGVVPVVSPTDAFAVESEACDNGVPVGTEMRTVVPWVWGSVGRRLSLPQGRELVLSLRAGTFTVLATAEVGAALRLAHAGPLRWEVGGHVGTAINAWSGEGDRLGVVAGLETTLLVGP